jgi:protein translocase SecG subunit
MVVLLQAGRGGGLTFSGGSQVGSGGGSKLMQNMTEGSAALFMSLSLVLAYLSSTGRGAAEGEFLPEEPVEGAVAPADGAVAPVDSAAPAAEPAAPSGDGAAAPAEPAAAPAAEGSN